MFNVQEIELNAVRQKIKTIKQEYSEFRAHAEIEVNSMRDEIDNKRLSDEKYEKHIEKLEAELEARKEELGAATAIANETIKSRGLQEQVYKLTKELDKKDIKIGNMSKAILQLKEGMLKAAENAAENRIRESNEK